MDSVVEEFTSLIKPQRRFTLVPFDLIQLPTDPAYLVKGLIPREGLCVVWGPPKCGKSFWTYDVAMHIACGWKYRGRNVNSGPVVYVACEGERGLGARTEAYRREHKIKSGAPFYLLTTRLDLVGEHDALIADITAQVERPVAVVIDTLNRSIRGSESRDGDMGDYVKAADAIREAFGCAVIIIHHCGIESSRPRGHTSLTGACDTQTAVKNGRNGRIA
jgi:RecA-family ATPase